MRKGFTLVELLIVVVVLVTLMSIAFRIGAIRDDTSRRNETVNKIQRLENCLSGYFAAFGSYPPVAQLNEPNVFLKVDMHGIQNADGEEDSSLSWNNVEAACRAQPVRCSFPFRQEYDQMVQAWSDQLKEDAAESKSLSAAKKAVFAAGFDGLGGNLGRLTAYRDSTEWRDLQLFQFGLMSYLLPRYLLMMAADESFYKNYVQWTGNNDLPADPMTGEKYNRWDDVRHDILSGNKTDYARIANIPSQAACARWLPNLAGSVFCARNSVELFGVDIADEPSSSGFSLNTPVFSPGGYKQASTGQQYVLNFCTMRDGWWEELYYYSPPPYQSYVVWSSGKNKRTFPPWVSRETLDAKDNKTVSAWIEDDIRGMSH